MKILVRVFIAIAVLFFLKMCFGIFYIRMTHLSKEDLEWIKPATVYPTAIFESNSGRIAKLYIMNHYVNNTTDPFYFSSNSRWDYCANAGYKYIIVQDDVEIEGYFSISRTFDTDSLEFRTALNWFHTVDGINSFWKSIPIERQRFQVGERIFNNCIKIDSNNASYSEPRTKSTKNKIDLYVMSRKYGLLYYRFENGIEYFRKFKNV